MLSFSMLECFSFYLKVSEILILKCQSTIIFCLSAFYNESYTKSKNSKIEQKESTFNAKNEQNWFKFNDILRFRINKTIS